MEDGDPNQEEWRETTSQSVNALSNMECVVYEYLVYEFMNMNI